MVVVTTIVMVEETKRVDHTDSCALKGPRYICDNQPFTHSGKKNEDQGKAQCGTQPVNEAFHEVVGLINVGENQELRSCQRYGHI